LTQKEKGIRTRRGGGLLIYHKRERGGVKGRMFHSVAITRRKQRKDETRPRQVGHRPDGFSRLEVREKEQGEKLQVTKRRSLGKKHWGEENLRKQGAAFLAELPGEPLKEVASRTRSVRERKTKRGLLRCSD